MIFPITDDVRKDISQRQLMKILFYDSGTGIFTRLKCNQKCFIGKEAGSISVGRRGYKRRIIMVNGKSYLAARLAWLYMTGVFPKLPFDKIDHINHDSLDNRWINLRVVDYKNNAKNCSSYKNNKSGIVGVGWDKRDKKWRVQIGSGENRKHLGSFNSKKKAIQVRKTAEIQHGFHPNHGN